MTGILPLDPADCVVASVSDSVPSEVHRCLCAVMCMLYTCGKAYHSSCNTNVSLKDVAKLTTVVATQSSSSKTRLLFRMPIQACEAQEKVIHCEDLSDQQKGQMLSQIITYPDRALLLFEVPEYLLAHTLSAHLQGPPAGTVTTLW